MENSRFKFFLIPSADLPAEAQVLRPKLATIFKAHDCKVLTTPEMLFLVIATVCDHRKPQQWWMKGAAAEIKSPTYRAIEYKSVSESGPIAPGSGELLGGELLGGELLGGELLGGELGSTTVFGDVLRGFHLPSSIGSLDDFFTFYRLKNLPPAISRMLWLWSRDEVRLKLCDSAISPLEMLSKQASGERVVTCSRKSFLEGSLVDGKRDALEFLLHDLTHANLFFSSTYHEQRDFFKRLDRKLSAAREVGDVCANASIYKGDADFKTALEYIMSDMNSNRAHLQQSLKAAVIAHERRRQKLEVPQRLSAQSEREITDEWSSLW